MDDREDDNAPAGPPPGDAYAEFEAAADAEWVRLTAALDAGRERIPQEWELAGPAVSLSLGDAADLDPALLAVIAGPDGLGGQALGPAFSQGAPADALRPSPVLAALTEQAVAGIGALSDDELIGAVQAAQRLENRAAYLRTVAVGEFARRRAAQFEDARARRVPAGRRPGEFPADELSAELLVTSYEAELRIEHDRALTGRLPATLAGMGDGLISLHRADVIAAHTAALSDADAAYADAILAAIAPGLRIDQLARKAAALEMKLAPDAVRARKEHARQLRRRVEVKREDSGNASIAGRELDTADALASKAYIDALAVRLRNSGLIDGTLPVIRALVMTELLQGRNPLDLIKPRPGASLRVPGYRGPDGAPPWTPDEAANARYDDADERDDIEELLPRRGPLRPGESAPPPATINLIIPIGTLLGWSAAPAQAGAYGLLDPEETRALAAAASRHPRTRWSATIIDPTGQAIAHGRARGQHPWNPPPPHECPPGQDPPQAPPGTSPPTVGQLAKLQDLLRALNLTTEPIAQGDCDHRHAENRYTPSRKLRDLLRARTTTCDAPGCNAQAAYCDQDHTVPYPQGPTCECNLGPKCRRHHRAKQAPGWRVERPEPGTARWTLPNGRTHTTHPTTYDTYDA
jgi:hypothetical protein